MSENEKHGDVCPAKFGWMLDLGIRKWIQNPDKILAPFIEAGQTVVDLGSGPGFFTTSMAKLVGPKGKVIAVDLQQGMLDQLARKLDRLSLTDRVHLHKCSESSLELTEKADLAIAIFVIHEIPDQPRLFKEVFECLNPGGKFLIIEPKMHVAKASYEESIKHACACGFTVGEGPKRTFSRTNLLTKPQ